MTRTTCFFCSRQFTRTDQRSTVIRCPRCAKWQIDFGTKEVKPAAGPMPAAKVPPLAPGPRRRRYYFERLYVTYFERLTAFRRRLRAWCGTTWDWFLHGGGRDYVARFLGVALAIALTVVAIFYLLLFLLPQFGQWEEVKPYWALAFMAAPVTLAVVAILAVFVKKKETWVHLAAAATAVGAVLLVVVPAVALAVIGFSVYLVALVLLTGSLFVVFVPLWLSHQAWLLWRGIARRCPYDDCGRGGLPVHVCSCGARYADLLPSFYGIFYHPCQHDDRQVQLPTMDFLGRSKLPRLCGHCQRPLIFSSFGELPERPIAVVGGPNAGKTVFLRQAIRQLRQRLASDAGARLSIDSEAHQRELAQDLEQLDRGQVLPKTSGDVMQAFALALRLRKPKLLRALLYLFDAPGEHFATIRRFGRKHVVQHLTGIVLLVDPFALPALAEHARRLGKGISASTTPLDKVVGVLLGGVNQMQTRQAGGKCTVPLAVVLAKTDALPAAAHPFLADLCPANGKPADDGQSARCREALVRLGAGNSVRALEQGFASVRYFGCTALGRAPDPRDTSAFRPAGVAEPLLWLLGLDPSFMRTPC